MDRRRSDSRRQSRRMAHSTEKTEEVEGRKSVPAQWIDTIRFTLADIVARGEWDDFGLFRILNRISFACRFHLMFVVVFRTSVIMNGSEVRTEYKASPVISSLDPVFFDLIFSYMKKYKIITLHMFSTCVTTNARPWGACLLRVPPRFSVASTAACYEFELGSSFLSSCDPKSEIPIQAVQIPNRK